MKLTIREANEAKDYLTGLATANDRLTYAAKKNEERINKAAEPFDRGYNEAMSDLRDAYCLTDKETGEKLVYPNGNPKFSPEKSRDLNKAAKPVIDNYLAQEINFEPFYAKLANVPGFNRIDKLDMFTIEKLTGILFDPALYSEGELIAPIEPKKELGEVTEFQEVTN